MASVETGAFEIPEKGWGMDVKRLLLFDIDGTLVRGGPAKRVFEFALASVFGTAGAIDGHDFSGKTDPQIARELLTAAGLPEEEIEAGLPTLWRTYLAGLKKSLPATPMNVIPGVGPLLEYLEGREDVALGLLTGNIVEGARLKLGSVGMDCFFSIGGYGSDSEIRDDLPPIAMERATKKWGRPFESQDVVVIGDTPRDVSCGKNSGTRTVAVATGRFERRALEETGADHVLNDMTSLDETLGALLR